MNRTIKVLDHGFVRLVDKMGSDESIVEAARESTSKGFLGWGPRCAKCGHSFNATIGFCEALGCEGREAKAGDEKLLAYLYDNRHDTPFEMADMVIQVQAPIFVFREWHRHRTMAYNEMSARYAPLPDVNYVPTVERLMLGGGHLTKQAASATGAPVLDEGTAREFRSHLIGMYSTQEEFYQWALKMGVPKELARVDLPVGRYSRMRAKANLRNWLAFLTLRADANAQFEIRMYAYAVGHIISQLYPRTWDLFLNHDRKKPVIDRDGFLRVDLEAA